MERMNGETLNIVADNIQKLKQIFPEVFNEDKVDFEKLEAVLGEYKDNGTERYNFSWPGKSKAIRIAQTPSTGTLRPCKEESKNWDTTQNLYIEGDNLEVLKLLQKSYYGKVKMIYIDPPYNTGNDFVYKDDFKDNIENYLEITGQKDEEGNKTTTNTEANGRYHSNWLNMMYPRLKLARNLLRDDGLIFISIDDNEIDNLKKICNEIFGELNYINQICIKTKPTAGASGGGEDKKLKKNIEYLICYVKNRNSFDKFNDVFEEYDLFELINDMKNEGKSWKYTRALLSFGERKFYKTIKDGSGEDITIYKHENVIIKSISELIKEEIKSINKNISEKEKKSIAEKNVYFKYFNQIFRDTNAQSSIRTRVIEATDNCDTFYSIEYIPKSGKNKGSLITQYYKGKNKDLLAWLSDIAEKSENTIIKKEKLGTLWSTFNWNNVTKEGDVKYSNGKKPIELIKRTIKLATNQYNQDIILDFFAGSASTAHAIIQCNLEDKGNRRYVMVQLPENLEENFKCALGETKKQISECIQFLNSIKKPLLLSELGKERIRRSINKMIEENKDKDEIKDLDIGFKVFKLDSSNINRWDSSYNQDLEHNLLSSIENIKEGRTEEDILYEVLLKYGIDLNMPIEEHDIKGKKVFDIGFGAIIACLDDNISLDVVEGIGKLKEELNPDTCRVVFMDNGFSSDSVKTNAVQILKRFNIEDVKSI